MLMGKRAGTAEGVIFIPKEDELGTGNLVAYAEMAAQDRAALVGARRRRPARQIVVRGWRRRR